MLDLAGTAARRGIVPRLCAQPERLSPAVRRAGFAPARCIDAERLAAMAVRQGVAPPEARERGNRPGCACHAARDIGAYETCPHGCVYCYAVRSPATLAARLRRHDPAAPALIPDRAAPVTPE